MNVNALNYEELEELYIKVKTMREAVLSLVQKYDHSASTLVSRTFEKEIEAAYGRKKLKGK